MYFLIKNPFVLVIVMCLFITTKSLSQIKDSINPLLDKDKILWSSNKLKWDDFKGVPPTNKGIIEAETQCEIKFLNIKVVENIPKITLGTFFVKSKSWTMMDNLLLLKHEQLHFDIYELYTRKIRKKFEELNQKKVSDFKVYQKYYNQIVHDAIKTNEKYDSQVYFNKKRQLEWISHIKKSLENLKQYKYLPESE